jgi:sulfide dehydrogenase cytochrome subunit
MAMRCALRVYGRGLRNFAHCRVCLVVLALAGSPAWAQFVETNAGRAIAASCASCHGTNGVSAGGIESLAGRPKGELVALMRDFKSGQRKGTLMPQLAKGYSDQQIEELSAWFAAQAVRR